MDIHCCIHDTCMRVLPAEWLYSCVHYHMTTQPHWPYMDIHCCIHDTCMRVLPAEGLYSCAHTLSHDYATIYGSCICITRGAKVRHVRTIPIYVHGPVMINRHFDMIHIHEPIRGPGFGSHDMIPWSPHDLSRG